MFATRNRLRECAETDRIYLRGADGAVVTDSPESLAAEFHEIDFDALHLCIENNIVFEGDGEEIDWKGVIDDYLTRQETTDTSEGIQP